MDRNGANAEETQYSAGSLSARRAWIEMVTTVVGVLATLGRSPQGERG